MPISTTEAALLFKQSLPSAISDKIEPTNFLRSIFKPKFSSSLNVSVEVKRNLEKIAVDINRASQGNLNKGSISTLKVYEPLAYKEFISVNSLASYNRVFGTTGYVNGNDIDNLLDEVSDEVSTMKAQIDRAFEKQCSDALFTRTITPNVGDVISFKKKTASNITPSIAWSSATAKPLDDLASACTFIRTKGKTQLGVFNALMSENSYAAFKSTTQVKEQGDWSNIKLIDLSMPDFMSSTGAVFHGRVSVGSYLVDVWTYPSTYEDASNTSVPYVPAGKVVVFPNDIGAELRYGGMPVKTGDLYTLQSGEFHVRQYNDEAAGTSFFEVSSAGLAIPNYVDRIANINAV